MVQVGPPWVKLAFHCRTTPSSTDQLLSAQLRGALVIESRGMETTTADLRSAERWTTRLVSERAPATPYSVLLEPYFELPIPSRVSEPMTRMFTGARLVSASVVA